MNTALNHGKVIVNGLVCRHPLRQLNIGDIISFSDDLLKKRLLYAFIRRIGRFSKGIDFSKKRGSKFKFFDKPLNYKKFPQNSRDKQKNSYTGSRQNFYKKWGGQAKPYFKKYSPNDKVSSKYDKVKVSSKNADSVKEHVKNKNNTFVKVDVAKKRFFELNKSNNNKVKNQRAYSTLSVRKRIELLEAKILRRKEEDEIFKTLKKKLRKKKDNSQETFLVDVLKGIEDRELPNRMNSLLVEKAILSNIYKKNTKKRIENRNKILCPLLLPLLGGLRQYNLIFLPHLLAVQVVDKAYMLKNVYYPNGIDFEAIKIHFKGLS